jgi:hypothetical protein
MALTAGFKKFLGLIAVTAVVGAGIYYYKQMPKAAPTDETATVTAPAETAQADTAPPTAQANPDAHVRADDPTEAAEAAPAETTPPKRDASTNRGLDAVLNAGKK